jgi:hypothetical protein
VTRSTSPSTTSTATSPTSSRRKPKGDDPMSVERGWFTTQGAPSRREPPPYPRRLHADPRWTNIAPRLRSICAAQWRVSE